jgi:hypothetical protein
MTLAITAEKKGLRYADPLSSILFNIVAGMLAVMIEHTKLDGQTEGTSCRWWTIYFSIHLIKKKSILQYMDNTILFMEHDLEKYVNLTLTLIAFEEILGLKINYQKSELFVSVRPRMRTISY